MSDEQLEKMFYDVVRLSMSLSVISRYYKYDPNGDISKQLSKVADSLTGLLESIKKGE